MDFDKASPDLAVFCIALMAMDMEAPTNEEIEEIGEAFDALKSDDLVALIPIFRSFGVILNRFLSIYYFNEGIFDVEYLLLEMHFDRSSSAHRAVLDWLADALITFNKHEDHVHREVGHIIEVVTLRGRDERIGLEVRLVWMEDGSPPPARLWDSRLFDDHDPVLLALALCSLGVYVFFEEDQIAARPAESTAPWRSERRKKDVIS